MIRIAICCGEGFSSGFLARHLAQAAEHENLQDQVSFIYIPLFQLEERQDEIDIAMIMPHMEPKARAKQDAFHIPLYVIPYKVIVKPTAKDFMEDAEDILSMASGSGGLFSFPEELRTQTVSRLQSHRRWLAEDYAGQGDGDHH